MMAITYKLIDGIHERTKIQVVQRVNGIAKYRYMHLDPGVIYEAEDDTLFVDSLRKATVTKRHTDVFEAELTAAGIEYEVTRRKCCGGKTKMIQYHIVEVMDDAESD